MPFFRSLAPVFLAVTLAACGDKAPSSAPAPAPAPTASQPSTPTQVDAATRPAPAAPAVAASTDARRWAGKWLGPEGTYLNLVAEDGGKYQVAIRNLDGERIFAGQTTADSISFERDGTREAIRATDGDATGMKWLAGKKDCLTVRPGEGYCRD